MLKIAVCDDDGIFISGRLKPVLSRALKALEISAEPLFFTDGELLLREFQRRRDFDVVLLDIEMPSMNGKNLAGKLREIDKDFRLAFISSYKDEVFNVFSLDIAGFIPKNLDNNELFERLTELLSRCSEKPAKRLFNVSNQGKRAVVNVSLDSILYIKTDNGIIFLRTDEETIPLTERLLKNLEKELLPQGFFRIHGNILVNVVRVYEVLDNEVILSNRERLPISRRRRRDLLAELSKVISAKVVSR